MHGANEIYGVPISILKGRTIRARPPRYRQQEKVPLTGDQLKKCALIEIFLDRMKVNKELFPHTKGKNTRFLTIGKCVTKGKK